MEEEIQKQNSKCFLLLAWGLLFFCFLFCTFLATSKSLSKRTACAHAHTHTRTQADAPYTGVLCAMWDATVQLTDAAQWRLISEHVAITHTHKHTLILFTAFTVVFQAIWKYFKINCYYDVNKGGCINKCIHMYVYSHTHICITLERHSNILKINMIEYGKWFTFWNARVCVCVSAGKAFPNKKHLEPS